MNASFRRAGALLALLLAGPAVAADAARCHYIYGGETKTLPVVSAGMPYLVPSHAIGSYFRLRVVLESEPAELAALKTYIYADRDGGPVLVHQGEWPWPAGGSDRRRHGFTGMQRVYEPVRDGELEYWCDADGAAGEGAPR